MASDNETKDMILVSGIPRSGTTWISRVLSYSDSTSYYYEPDNEHNSLLGYIYKQQLHRFPYLRESDGKTDLYNIYRDTLADRYMFDYSKTSLLIKKLFGINLNNSEMEVVKKCNHLDRIRGDEPKFSLKKRLKLRTIKGLYYLFQMFENHNRSKRLPLVKSVHSILALPYLQSYFNTQMVVVLRHPFNIVSSHLRLDNQDIYRNIFTQERLVKDYLQPYIEDIQRLQDPLEKAGAQVAAFYHVLGNQIKSNPDWMVMFHEELCRDPLGQFERAYEQLDLPWSDAISRKIEDMNRDGGGYTPTRVASRQINKWKRELESEQVEKIRRGYSTIKPTFYKNLVYQNAEMQE